VKLGGSGTGHPIELAIGISGADAVEIEEGNMGGASLTRVRGQPGGVKDPGMCRPFLGVNRELCVGHRDIVLVRIGR